MSWIIGIKGHTGDSLIGKIKTFLPEEFNQVQTKDLQIFCGGFSKTLIISKSNDDSKGFIVSGIGIIMENEHAKFMNLNDWQNIDKRDIKAIRKLNGHFTGIKWNTTSTVLFTDVLGLREMYLTRFEKAVIFSTRQNWLSQLRGDCQIDFEQFGTVWQSFNQLSYKSIILNIKRLGPGSIASIENSKVNYDTELWLPNKFQHSSADRVINKIKKFTLFPLNNNQMVSLGLSGGIDSRVLLKILSSQQNRNWGIHTFGDKHHPDALIAKNIATKLNIDLTILNTQFPPADKCVKIIENYFGQNTVHIPASEIMRLIWYTPLDQQNKIVIDGGFGEIARRQYLNRLSIKGREALLHKDAEAISKYLRHHRANIFNSETISEMNLGYLHQIESFLEDMPDVNKFGIENWLDLLAIRFRLANWFGFAQACVDGLAINYMPFAQKDFLNEILVLPIRQRKNGRLWRNIIKDSLLNLEQFPLVKGSVSYPFRLSTIGAMVWTTAKHKFGLYYRDTESVVFVDHLHEFIQDAVNSKDVKSYPHYDYGEIKMMVEKYFSGEKKYSREIDWWLAFEIWRRSL
jgi:hypothetical protein